MKSLSDGVSPKCCMVSVWCTRRSCQAGRQLEFSFHFEQVCYLFCMMAWVKVAETTAQSSEPELWHWLLISLCKNMGGEINMAGYHMVN